MANHKSSIKRIRQEEKRRLHNRYYAKTMRNAVKNFNTMYKQKQLLCSLVYRKCWINWLNATLSIRTKLPT